MTELTNERAAFEAWFAENRFGGMRDSMWAAWGARAEVAARRATPSSECALPPLPEPSARANACEYPRCACDSKADCRTQQPASAVQGVKRLQDRMPLCPTDSDWACMEAEFADLRAQLAIAQQAKEYEQRHAAESEAALAQVHAQLARATALADANHQVAEAAQRRADAWSERWLKLRQSQEPQGQAAPDGYVLVPKKITQEMIEAAMIAHYGKRRVGAVGGAGGVSMTVNNTDYSGTQAMRRFWSGALAAAPAHPVAQPAPAQDDAHMHLKVAEIAATAARSSERVAALKEKYGVAGAQPVAVEIKDHNVRQLVNDLTAIGAKFGSTQQLRSRISDAVAQFLGAECGWRVAAERQQDNGTATSGADGGKHGQG